MASIIKRGNAWRASVRRKGVRLDGTFDTEDEAKAWAKAREETILAGRPIEPKPVIEGFTVPQLFVRYSKEVSPNKGGSRWEQIRLNALACDPLLQGQAMSFDGAAMATWRDRRLTEVTAATVNRELNIISAVFTRAIKEWRLPLTANPVGQIQRPKQPPHRRRRVSEAERAKLLTALGWDGVARPATRRQYVAWSLCFAIETMMRRGEILRLTWEHVHPKWCHLPKTKNGHARNVPLSTRAVALLELLGRGEDKQRVVPVKPDVLSHFFADACRRAGIEDMHFHDSRREALTRTAPKLGDPLTLASASGHRDIRQLRVYYEPNPEDLADKLG
jgi:integrase